MQSLGLFTTYEEGNILYGEWDEEKQEYVLTRMWGQNGQIARITATQEDMEWLQENYQLVDMGPIENSPWKEADFNNKNNIDKQRQVAGWLEETITKNPYLNEEQKQLLREDYNLILDKSREIGDAPEAQIKSEELNQVNIQDKGPKGVEIQKYTSQEREYIAGKVDQYLEDYSKLPLREKFDKSPDQYIAERCNNENPPIEPNAAYEIYEAQNEEIERIQ